MPRGSEIPTEAGAAVVSILLAPGVLTISSDAAGRLRVVLFGNGARTLAATPGATGAMARGGTISAVHLFSGFVLPTVLHLLSGFVLTTALRLLSGFVLPTTA